MNPSNRKAMFAQHKKDMFSAELIGKALNNSPEDRIGRPIMSYSDWKKIANKNNLDDKTIKNTWEKFGKWHYKQHKKKTPILYR